MLEMDGSFIPNEPTSDNLESSRLEEEEENFTAINSSNQVNSLSESFMNDSETLTKAVQQTQQNENVAEFQRSFQIHPYIPYIKMDSLSTFKRVNSGTNGAIYTSEMENSNESVIVKEEFGTKIDKQNKVWREAEKLFALKDVGNVIEIKGLIQRSDSADSIVMEKGDYSLKTFQNECQKILKDPKYSGTMFRDVLSYRQCLEFLIQIASGMNEAHLKVILKFKSIFKSSLWCNQLNISNFQMLN